MKASTRSRLAAADTCAVSFVSLTEVAGHLLGGGGEDLQLYVVWLAGVSWMCAAACAVTVCSEQPFKSDARLTQLPRNSA